MASQSRSASAISSSTAGKSDRVGSIHTPLSPANVQDLKAKFDAGKGTNVFTVTTNQRNRVKADSQKRGLTKSSVGKDVSLTSSAPKSSSSVTLSSVNSSLQAAAQRKLDSSTSTILSISSVPSSNLRSTSKSSSSITSARPFSPSSLLSSKSGSASSSGRNSPCIDSSSKVTSSFALSSVTNRCEPKSVTRPAPTSVTSTPHTFSTVSIPLSPSELRSSLDRNLDGLVELPYMQITTSGSEVTVHAKPRSSTFDTKLCSVNDKTSDVGSSYIAKKIPENKLTFSSDSSTMSKLNSQIDKSVSKENSPPIQLNKLVAREFKIQQVDSEDSVTSYKDSIISKTVNSISTTSKTASTYSTTETASTTSATKTTESLILNTRTGKVIKKQPSSSNSKNTIKPEFAQVKLRKTRSEDASNPSSPRDNLKILNSDVCEKRVSCKINSERFERLMFDFQRGVPSETIVRRGSETDHITLQQKASELSKPVPDDDVPVISKKKKESSIFTEGLKVSDFVKQVNKLNPETENLPKWKVHRLLSETSSSTSIDAGGDNFYQGIPGEDTGNVSDDNDIYEKVTNRAQSLTDEEQDGEFTKTPGRRMGVYRKQRGSKKKVEKSRSNKSKITNSSEERATQSDGGICENCDFSSSGTEYEDISPDGNDFPDGTGVCLYEDLEDFSKPTSEAVKKKNITHKLKNIFYKSGAKNKKSKSFIDSGVSGGTESEADTVDETEETDNDITETFSRTGSERSSGHLSRDVASLNTTISSLSTAVITSNADEASSPGNHPQISVSASNMHPPPPLPPRTTKTLIQPLENSPPLPPRNPSLSNKITLGNIQDSAMPFSPIGKTSNHTVDKAKDMVFLGGNSQDGCDTEVPAVPGYIDHDHATSAAVEKFERSNSTSKKRRSLFGCKTSSTSHPGAASTTTSSSSYIYPDISAFPELKGNNPSLYVDLEDAQIYGKASDFYVSKFESEPLYQWYSKNKVIQNLSSYPSTSDDLSSDDEYLDERRHPESLYEDVEKLLERANGSIPKTVATSDNKCSENKKTGNSGQISAKSKPERRSVIEEVFKKGGSLHRALWCQMPEVIESGILSQLTEHEKKIQEAMFEIITSEASYLKSLKVLISVFLMAPEFSSELSDQCVTNRWDKQILFSNIGHIKDISEDFLKDLEDRWQESCYIKDICDIIYKHASQKFEPYVRYCGNQAFQDRAINALRLNTDFTEAVKRLEQHPDCQFLPLASFLLLPMQRITRLPLLVDAIYHRLEPSSPAHSSAKKAMDSLTKVAKQCDDAAKKMQQTEQICILKSNLEFKIKEFPLISASRFLVKQGELIQIKVDGGGRKPLSKLLGSNKEHVYLFLFNDILLVTKKKGSIFQVRDYCQRNTLHIEAIDNPDRTHHIPPGATTGIPNILFLAMLANHENRQVEMVLSCKSESERFRWVDAIMPKHMLSDTERIYDCWDCPQFHCVRKYIAQQPDELTLEESDVINVARKMADGWYEGERIRDGEKGWFPSSHVEEINNSHVRARNLRLRYRLLRASQEYAQMELHKK